MRGHSPYPIARNCPECGETGYRRPSEDDAAFILYDRICRACGTRYTPPVPLWMCRTVVGVGQAMVAASALFALLMFAGYFKDLLELSRSLVIIPVMFGVLGVVFVRQGIAKLRLTKAYSNDVQGI